MSTLSIDAGSPVRLAPRTRPVARTRATVPSVPSVRLTRRGQVVVVAAALLAAFALMIAFGGLATATRESGPAPAVEVVEVAEGDTLYGIAGQYAEPGEVREMVHRIQELNGIEGSLQAGDDIAVPLS